MAAQPQAANSIESFMMCMARELGIDVDKMIADYKAEAEIPF